MLLSLLVNLFENVKVVRLHSALCLIAPVRYLQDAQEFFLLLMNTIHENDQTAAVRETEEVARRHHVRAGLADLLRPPVHPTSRTTLALGLVGGLVSSGAAMRNPFDGQQACSYQCRACHAKYVFSSIVIYDMDSHDNGKRNVCARS